MAGATSGRKAESLIALIGGTLWKIIDIAGNVDFVISFESKGLGTAFQMIFDYGWLVLLIGGLALILREYLVSVEGVKGRRQRFRLTWASILLVAMIAFVSGVALAIQWINPTQFVVRSWNSAAGPNRDGCMVRLDGDRLVNFAPEYRIIYACGVVDPTVERLDDARITLSPPRRITSGIIEIAMFPSQQFLKARPSYRRIWHLVFLFPAEANSDNLKTLADIQRAGGRILPSGGIH